MIPPLESCQNCVFWESHYNIARTISYIGYCSVHKMRTQWYDGTECKDYKWLDQTNEPAKE
jgi:hypothetical protein